MARCPGCGKDNPGYVIYCGHCGKEIPADARKASEQQLESNETTETGIPVERPREPTLSSMKRPAEIVTCAYCGADQESGLLRCPSCGKNPKGPWEDDSDYLADGGPASRDSSSGSLLAGGVLAIIAGVLAFGQGLLYVVVGGAVSYLPGAGSLCLCGGLDILFGLGSIAGGVFAIQRKHFALALLGAVVGMLGIGLLIGFLLGLIALILIAVSRNEFER